MANSSPAPQSRSAAGLNDKLIAERITTLLSHYWTADDPPEIRALQMADWLDDLCEFPAPAVAKACETWRRTERKRPTPADIRSMVMRWQAEAQAERMKAEAARRPKQISARPKTDREEREFQKVGTMLGLLARSMKGDLEARHTLEAMRRRP